MPQLDVRIKRFTRESINVSDVKLTVLKLIEEEERHIYGDPLDVVAKILEEESKNQNLDYVMVEVQGQGFKNITGEGLRRSGGILLYPKPAQLKKIGIVRVQTLKSTGDSGYYRFKEDEIEWFNIDDEKMYVYDSYVEASQDVIFLVIDTSDGRSITRVQRSLPPQQSYQLQSQQGRLNESSASS